MDRRTAVAFLMAALGIGLTASLGAWQLRRAAEKLSLQAQWERVIGHAAEPLTPTSLDDVAQRVPLRIRARGRWLSASTVWLDNRPLDGRAGFWMVTPLRLAEGGAAILVYRGWAPRDRADRLRVPLIAEAADETEIEGIALPDVSKLLELGRPSYPTPMPAVWQNLDFKAFESASRTKVARFVVHQTDAARQGEGLTRQPLQIAAGVDRHYGYAVQWFSLAALIAGLTVFFGWRTRRSRSTAP